MSQKIALTLSIQVLNGPAISDAQTLEVDAYDTIQVDVPAAAGNNAGHIEVQVQPGGVGQVRLLVLRLLQPAQYADGRIAYSVNAAANAGDRTHLDAPLVLAGPGAVSLLKVAPNSLHLYNTSDAPVSTQMLVGRAVIAP